MITVDPGQRINVTLLDFSIERTYQVRRIDDIDSFDIEATVCREYAVIHEVETEWKTMVCGGTTREQHVYLSKTNTLRIVVTDPGDRHFLLKYEGEYVRMRKGLRRHTSLGPEVVHAQKTDESGD